MSNKNLNLDNYGSSLTQFGLKPQEAKVYLASLKLGQATVGLIAETADVQRTFVYDIVRALAEQGLMSQVEIRGKLHFASVSLGQFQKIQENKLKKFAEMLPELKALEKTAGDRPRVQFFEGEEGIKTAFEDTFNQPAGSEILMYSTTNGFYAQFPEYLDKYYLPKRIAKNISVRLILPKTPMGIKYSKKDREQLRTSRLVPVEKFPFSNEIDIYGNKVAIVSLAENEYLAVIIESESIANTQRAIFELAWHGAENLTKK